MEPVSPARRDRIGPITAVGRVKRLSLPAICRTERKKRFCTRFEILKFNYPAAVENPGGRWLAVIPGTLGDLVTSENAFNIFGGLSKTGLTDFTLHSEVVFEVTALGTTQLTFAENSNLITAGGGSVANAIVFGTGSVTSVP